MNWRKNIVFLLLSVSMVMFGQTQKKKTATVKPFTVVIDAGHGGHDPGALGKITQEKKLNLDVSLLLGKMIEDGFDDVQVYYTRKTDVFLTLQERANFVNKHNADLFICIHTNASESRQAVGAETFVLGIDKLASNLSVAMRENSVMLLEDNYETTYQGFDPNSVESYIMFELMQDQYIDRSLQFATQVQQEFTGTLKRADRGVRQAGFWVLHKSACPSVLIEMGFISNPDEEVFLASKDGKASIATAIYDAFVTYKGMVDKKSKPVKHDQGAQQVTEETTSPVVSVEERKDETVVVVEETKDEAIKKDESVASQQTVKATDEKKAVRPVYRVQIFAVGRQLKANDPTFKGLKNCKFTLDGKFYKYTYGEETDYEAILAVKQQVQEKFPGCFVVAFLGDEQILVKDARKM